MARWQPDPTFYPSPRIAMEAPPEKHGYVAMLGADANGRTTPDALGVVDLDPESPSYTEVVGTLEMPETGDELHHFGWNACSSALCPSAGHPHIERRYLLVPGLRSSRIYVVDTKPDPRQPRITRTIEAEEVRTRGKHSRPHTVHCGPDAIYVSAMGGPEGDEGPGGIFMLDHFTFDVIGPWEEQAGSDDLAYDFWWHINDDVMITSEWAVPRQFEKGLVPEDLLGGRYGHRLNFWDMKKRQKVQSIDLGPEHQMVLEVRPAHNPRNQYGFVGVVISTKDLSGSVWAWYRENGQWAMKKVITIPAEPAAADDLPPLLKGFEAAPPLISDIDLSLDDRYLYVSCWGTGQLRQYDVSDPLEPEHVATVELGGLVRHAAHPRGEFGGGPQMVEVSRDGKRVYVTNSLYSSWDEQFYGGPIPGRMAKMDVPEGGGLQLDSNFLVDFDSKRAHQIRLEGGDSSTDSFCFA